MSLFSENKTPWLTFLQQQATPGASPAAGLFRLFLTAANTLGLVDSTGTLVTTLGAAGANGTNGTDGIDGLPGVNGTNGTNGVGVPVGGTTGQALVKNSNADYDTKWSTVAASGGSGGGGGGTPGIAVPLTYVSDGDTNGLFYFIGQTANGSWQNPQGMGMSEVGVYIYPAGDGSNNGSVGDLTGRNGSGFYLNPTDPNGLQIDVGPGRSLNPNNVSIQNRNGYDGTALTNVNLYASQDGVNFTLLCNLPVNLNLQNSWATCPVPAQNLSFRYFRLLRNGPNNAGTQHFCCGQIEMYGTLNIAI